MPPPVLSPKTQFVAGTMLCASVLLLWVVGESVGSLPVERSVGGFSFERRAHTPAVSGILQFFGGLGVWPIALVTVTLAAWITARTVSLSAALFVLVAVLGVFAQELLAHVLGPSQLRQSLGGRHAGDAGYPSGHVTYVVVLTTSIALVGWRRGRPEPIVVSVVLIAGMCFARVYDGSHLLSEVLAAVLFGAGWVVASDAVARSRWLSPSPLLRRCRPAP